ncbi:MAG TPA: hypothetical protein P5543_01435 [Planctomycetota bacterium]|nr:hypothetical protein [Planctomycetota bacterium]
MQKKNKIITFLILLYVLYATVGGSCSWNSHYGDDDDDHYVVPPDVPDGPAKAKIDEEVEFTVKGSRCYHCGKHVEYRMNFGNDVTSDWSEETKFTYAYKFDFKYFVYAQARCKETKRTSFWSHSHTIKIEDKRDKLQDAIQMGDQTICAIGNNGIFLQQTPEKITHEHNLENAHLFSIHEHEKNIYITGNNGSLFQIDNSITKKFQIDNSTIKKIDLQTHKNLYKIHSNENTLIIVGQDGVIYHLQNQEWKQIESPTKETLWSVYVLDNYTAFACGTKGTILQYNGNIWTQIQSPTKEDLHDIFALDYSHIWIVGNNGTILSYDGIQWTQHPINTNENFQHIKGTSLQNIYISTDNTIYSFHNQTLQATHIQQPIYNIVFMDHELYIVTINKKILHVNK